MKQADSIIGEGVHPRVIADGLEIAKEEALAVLESMKIKCGIDRESLLCIARTSL